MHIHEINYKNLEQWRIDLGKRAASKTASNILGEFHRFLRWLVRCGDLDHLPEFPVIPHDSKAPKILFPDEQAAVLAAIPWEHRGIFLAMAHTMRPGEARGANLEDLRLRQKAIHVCRASKGSEAIAPVLLAKERNWRIIGADDELWAWIEWRIERATKAEQLRKVGVPLFPNWRARRHLNPDRRWSQCSIHWEWKAACAVVGVEGVSVYPGTKHTTATDLIRRGRSRGAVQKLLGHADPRSTDAYVQLSDDDTINMIRRRKD